MFRTSSIARGSLLALLVGCGGGSGGGAPISVAQMVSQLNGGEVKIGTGGAALMIPPGSLAADTTITANAAAATAAVPSHDTVKGLFYEMGPDGTTFDPPATLTLPLGGKPPGNATVVISMLSNGQWTNLETTESSAGLVSAQVAHFTGFAVRWLTGDSVAPDDCTAPPDLACGGDLVADWTPTKGCFFGEQLDGCDGTSRFSYVVDLMGEANFKDDLTYSLDLPYSVTGRVRATSDCLRVAGFTSCAEMQEQLVTHEEASFPTLWSTATCAGTATTGCDCTSTGTGSFAMPQTGSYTAVEAMLSTTAMGEDPGAAMAYCVEGNKLWVKLNTDSTEPEYLVFTK
jgi:hypothetical protein